MKLVAMFGAVAIAAGTIVTATPAEAQRYGWHDRGPGWHGGGPGWDRGRGHGWGRGPGWDRGRRWDRGPRWHGGYGYRQPGYGYGRGRVVCRVVRGYYGPERRCFRA